ncbi:MAG: hypothetical protein ACLFRX_08435 [Gemmatimonadota bacterium]
MTQPNLTGLATFIRSPQARPLIREALWAAGIALVAILLAALISAGLAYGLYLAAAVFFSSALTGLFVSLIEKETGERVVESAALRRWLGGCALLLAALAAVILV